MTELDYGTLLCSATNKIGKQKHPCIFHIIAAGRSHLENRGTSKLNIINDFVRLKRNIWWWMMIQIVRGCVENDEPARWRCVSTFKSTGVKHLPLRRWKYLMEKFQHHDLENTSTYKLAAHSINLTKALAKTSRGLLAYLWKHKK